MSIIPPTKTFTPGLEFTKKNYIDPEVEFNKNYISAIKIVREKLASFRELKAILQLRFGDENHSKPPIFVDARGNEAQLLDSLPNDIQPDVQTTIKPEYLIRFHEGTLDPRLGLFQDARLYEPSIPRGDVPKLIRFADLLNKTPTLPLEHTINSSRVGLPKPTKYIEKVKKDIVEFGYGLVKDALSATEVEIIKKAVLEQAAGERQAGVAALDGGPERPNQRVWNLINKGDEFIDLLNHPLIDAIIPWFLGDHAHISTLSANIARPGNTPMQLHTDQSSKTPPQRNMALGLNISFYLVDVTDTNGATRVYPRSHNGNIAASNIWTVEGSVPVEGPAGTAIVFDNRLWHTTGPNRAKEDDVTKERPVILLHFVRSFVRAGENHYLSMRKDVEAKLPDRQKAFFGFRKIPGIGSVEGSTTVDFVSRKEDAIGVMRALP
ncbi:uncharacterized protein CTRU02_206647 [Colletotrichum truncatum]|uniref:Uncharacterized protein n=1 Tax=Colletotrichum truncatum TaxID=5467 RepID=A0ACC3Z7F5_COLTU|nr:uncharacterized protein CTRU02_13768 [Colletotrichum truncatum]KAF6782942.1 hypothetical protein CTRU02_13768 [Colletotrichum truncatum]